MTKFLTRNEKMMKMTGPRTFNWGIPALRSKDGFVTCPSAGKCAIGCFARAGWYLRRKVVVDAYERRLQLSLDPSFIPTMTEEIWYRKVGRLRIHDSGDFYNQKYLDDWITIINAFPNVPFYTYTKQVKLLKENKSRLPKNFHVVYSFGGKEDHLIRSTDFHCLIFETQKSLLAAGYVDASDDDAFAATGFNRKLGIVYHGYRLWENTSWPKVFIKEKTSGQTFNESRGQQR